MVTATSPRRSRPRNSTRDAPLATVYGRAIYGPEGNVKASHGQGPPALWQQRRIGSDAVPPEAAGRSMVPGAKSMPAWRRNLRSKKLGAGFS